MFSNNDTFMMPFFKLMVGASRFRGSKSMYGVLKAVL